MNISSQRLAGMIAGVFAVRAFDVSMSAVTQLVLPLGTFIDRLMIAAPALVGAVGAGYICSIYLRERLARWQHIVAIVLLSFGIVFGGFTIATALIVAVPNAGPMIAKGVVQIVFSAIAISFVAVLLKRSKATEPAATAQRP